MHVDRTAWVSYSSSESKLILTVNGEADLLCDDSDEVLSQTQIASRVVGVYGTYHQRPGVIDQVLVVIAAFDTGVVLAPADVRARSTDHVAR